MKIVNICSSMGTSWSLNAYERASQFVYRLVVVDIRVINGAVSVRHRRRLSCSTDAPPLLFADHINQ